MTGIIEINTERRAESGIQGESLIVSEDDRGDLYALGIGKGSNRCCSLYKGGIS